MTMLQNTNLVFIKVEKCSSSTAGGIVRRIAAHYNLHGYRSSNWINIEPGVWAHHSQFRSLEKKISNLTLPHFLLSVVRAPAERCLSAFYHFQVTRRGIKSTPNEKIKALRRCRDFIFNYIRTDKNSDDEKNFHFIKKNYNFIGLTERFDESMIVLAYKLNLTMNDILYIKSKDSNSSAIDQFSGHAYQPHSTLLNEEVEVKEFINSDEFRRNNFRDFELIKHVNKVLNKQIRKIGKQKFSRLLLEYQRLLGRANDLCSSPILAQYHNAVDITNVTDCYWRDNGCFYKCLDEIDEGSKQYLQ
jgi:hypothetical protein